MRHLPRNWNRAWRSVGISLLITATALTGASPVSAQGAVQSIGQYHLEGSALGVDSYAIMANPSNEPPHWVTAPVAVSTTGDVYIEAGPSRNLDQVSYDDIIHPYGAGRDGSGFQGHVVFYGIDLADGGQYEYFANNGPNTDPNAFDWQSAFCGFGSCYQLYTMDAGRAAFDYPGAGGESSDSDAHWGTISDQYTTYADTYGNFSVPWCWQFALPAAGSFAPGPCYDAGNGLNNSWNTSY